MCSKQMPIDTHRWFMETSIMDMQASHLYTRLLFTLWNQGTPYQVADDDELLQRLLGFPANWPSIKRQIFSFWTLENGVWLHQDLLAEHEKQQRTSASRRKNVETRWAKAKVTDVTSDKPINTKAKPGSKEKQSPLPNVDTPDVAALSEENDKWGSVDDLGLAKEIYQEASQIDPRTKEPNLAEWANTLRLMRDDDTYTSSDIRSIFQWAIKDDFWFKNVLTPAALRRNASKIHLDMLSASRKAEANTPTPRSMREIDYQAGINNSGSWLVCEGH